MSPGAATALRRTIGPFQFFALGFGTIIGSAWLIVLGHWLSLAGPGGSVLGFLVGAVIMCGVAAVYAELATRMPVAGGEFIYAYRLFGPRVGFFVGWFITLFLISVTAFEAIALPWLISKLLPGTGGLELYRILGEPVRLGDVLIGGAALLLVLVLNYRDVRWAVVFQSFITYGFIAAMLLVGLIGAIGGNSENIKPLFGSESGSDWTIGALRIAAGCAFFLSGFQAIPQAIEERALGISARTVARVMVGSVLAAALFYCGVLVASSLSSPWRTLVHTDLPAAAAVELALPGGWLSRIVLAVAALSLLKTWNAIALTASRLLLAQAREGLLPAKYAQLHPRYATPATCVLFVSMCTAVGMALGRGAVLPLLNMASICTTFAMVLTCLALLKVRMASRQEQAPFEVPGGTRIVVSIALAVASMSLFAFLEPLLRAQGSLPLEWLLLLAWGLIGAVIYGYRSIRADRRRKDVA